MGPFEPAVSPHRKTLLVIMFVLATFLTLGLVTRQEFQKAANPALNCSAKQRSKPGDRVLISYRGLLSTGDQFDRGEADFVLGENKVIKGWEQGFVDQCAGESIALVVPPSLRYGL